VLDDAGAARSGCSIDLHGVLVVWRPSSS
jgi:hypothetical protein